MPLERRVSFRGTAGFAAWFEEDRKNFITLSETDAMFKNQSPRPDATADRVYEDTGAAAFPASF